MEDLWHEACAAWDDELMTTEDIMVLAALLFPPPLLEDIVDELQVVDMCCV